MLCAVLAVAIVAYGLWTVAQMDRDVVIGYFGMDYRIYLVATIRWMNGYSFYELYQLAGPYIIHTPDVLYPPILIWLMVPFTVLPASLWWGIPIGLSSWTVLHLRPTPIVWPLLALCVVWPQTITDVIAGNPGLWALAAMSLGVLFAGPAVFVLVKPSLAPFALWGMRHRRWWLWLAVFGALSLPFGALWLQWVTALANSNGTLAYSLNEVPVLLIPVIAWLGRSGSVRSRSSRERPIQRTIGAQIRGIAPRL